MGCDSRLDPRLDSPVMQAPSYTGSSCGDTSELGIPLNNNGNRVPANGNGVPANGNGVMANADGAGPSSTDTNRQADIVTYTPCSVCMCLLPFTT